MHGAAPASNGETPRRGLVVEGVETVVLPLFSSPGCVVLAFPAEVSGGTTSAAGGLAQALTGVGEWLPDGATAGALPEETSACKPRISIIESKERSA